jgi:hypothetical protein
VTPNAIAAAAARTTPRAIADRAMPQCRTTLVRRG